MKKILSSNKGFSLIELIVVIAILGVLVGVAAPNLIGYVEKTRTAADTSNQEIVLRAAQAYMAENAISATMTTTEFAAFKADKFPGGFPKLQASADKNKEPSGVTVTNCAVDVTWAVPSGS